MLNVSTTVGRFINKEFLTRKFSNTSPKALAVTGTLVAGTAGYIFYDYFNNSKKSEAHLSKEKNHSDEKNNKSLLGDILARTSLSLLIAVNAAMLFTPLAGKAARSLINNPKLAKTAFQKNKKIKDFLQKMDKNATSGKALPLLTRISSFAALLQYNTGFQIGLNTKQPVKNLGTSIAALSMLAAVCKPKILFTQAIQFLGAMLFFVGESNDIKNNNNPESKREWDQNRIVKSLRKEKGAPPLSEELASMTKFIGEDIVRCILSIEPWKELITSIKNKDLFSKPQPCQTSLGAQAYFWGFLSAGGSLLAQFAQKRKNPSLKLPDYKNWAPEYKKLPKKFSRVTQIAVTFSSIAYLPVFMRALQNKTDTDGILTLIGVPLVLGKQILIGGLTLKHLQGLFNVGVPLVNEGKRINSQKYRLQADYLADLQKQAHENPSLTASDVLNSINKDPYKLESMKKNMGEFRVNYILSMLRKIDVQQKQKEITLAEGLQPAMFIGV